MIDCQIYCCFNIIRLVHSYDQENLPSLGIWCELGPDFMEWAQCFIGVLEYQCGKACELSKTEDYKTKL